MNDDNTNFLDEYALHGASAAQAFDLPTTCTNWIAHWPISRLAALFCRPWLLLLPSPIRCSPKL